MFQVLIYIIYDIYIYIYIYIYIKYKNIRTKKTTKVLLL